MTRQRRRACDPCNIRKVKCIPIEGSSICAACHRSKLDCTFFVQPKKSGPKSIRSRQAISRINSIQGANHATTTERIPASVIKNGIELYRTRLYGIWPLLEYYDLNQLDTNDQELYALATALVAATLSELEISIAVTEDSSRAAVTAEECVQESVKARQKFDYMENCSINSVLTSYFLHMYYGKQNGTCQKAIMYIREAISFAQLLKLHTEQGYTTLPSKIRAMARKLYYLLFMTERYLCIQFGLPVVLNKIALPDIKDEIENPQAVKAFLNLVKLFSLPEREFFESCSGSGTVPSDSLIQLQKQLELPLQLPKSWSDDILKVDVLASRHWIRSLAWKLSIFSGHVTTGASHHSMSATYPVEIARDLYLDVVSFPRDIFEVHGPGMEVKLFEVANSLADVVICAPACATQRSHCDLLVSLGNLVCQLDVKNQFMRDSFNRKMGQVATIIASTESIPAQIEQLPDADEAYNLEDSFDLLQYLS